jgi:hypothetical protein
MGIGAMVSLSAVGILSVQMSYSMATNHQQGDTCPTFEMTSQKNKSLNTESPNSSVVYFCCSLKYKN